ncbi:MAG: hypothetical protein H8M99_06980 [Gloeobacteraceae cyanobacterium ES-bin-144]|nr:hypothetical protein [Verrucomicrobiales bacterium]
MTQVTICQTQHNIPHNRETVGAAVRAVEKIVITTNNKTNAVVANEVPETIAALVITVAIAKIAKIVRIVEKGARKSSAHKVNAHLARIRNPN